MRVAVRLRPSPSVCQPPLNGVQSLRAARQRCPCPSPHVDPALVSPSKRKVRDVHSTRSPCSWSSGAPAPRRPCRRTAGRFAVTRAACQRRDSVCPAGPPHSSHRVSDTVGRVHADQYASSCRWAGLGTLHLLLLRTASRGPRLRAACSRADARDWGGDLRDQGSVLRRLSRHVTKNGPCW